MNQLEEILDSPGQVQIDNLTLISFKKKRYLDLTDYLVELNIFESIFSPTITGDITLSDSRNLIREFSLLGEEFLSITVRTPTLSSDRSISKIFRIYSLEDKKFAKDGSTLVYRMNFISVEAFQDLLNPIYKSFRGKPENIVTRIYEDYLITNRNVQISGEPAADVKTPLTFLGESVNELKFVSPGWSPIECISWICSKTMPANDKGANFLFWETTKGFYFGNLETILRKPEVSSIGNYVYSAPSITAANEESIRKLKFMFNIRSLSLDKVYDQLSNLMTGYTSNRILDVDIINKKFETVDYDHGLKFGNYSHLEKSQPVPLFDENASRNPLTCLKVHYSHPGLHTGIKNNFSERTKEFWGNRTSNMIELNNFKMEIMIPGRTDIECGQTIHIRLPKKSPGGLTQEDKNTYQSDDLYSGHYLIAELSHKINPRTHYCSMNVVRDSLSYGAVQQ